MTERERVIERERALERIKQIYIYIYKVISGAKFDLLKGYLRGQVDFFINTICPETTIKLVVSALFLKAKTCAPKLLKVISGAKLAFLCCTKLGP